MTQGQTYNPLNKPLADSDIKKEDDSVALTHGMFEFHYTENHAGELVVGSSLTF